MTNQLGRLNAWGGADGYSARTSAQGYFDSTGLVKANAAGGGGSSCGMEGDKPKPKPGACGSSCGAGDEKPKPKPGSCGSSCGAGDEKPKPKPSACGAS
jgi:hypothetical protein